MKITMRSLAQCVHSPSFDGGSIAMASPAGFGLDGRAATCTEVRNSNPSGVRESNRVTNWLFRMMAVLAVLLNGSMIGVHSANIKFLQTIPANGSEISTFDIKVKFDISEAITESGSDVIAIGYTGSTRNDKNTKLYDGTPETGTLITTVLTNSVKGVDYSNDYIDLGIPPSFVPEPGHTYTIVFGNQVAMFNNGSTVPNSVISYQNDPLTFVFYGTKASSGELLFQKASISNNDNLDVVKSVQFDFNEDISIVQDRAVQIFNGEELIGVSKSIEVDSNNPKTLYAIFDEETLYLGNQYTIILPEGIVSLKDDITVVNKPIEIKLNGTSTKRLSTKSVSPEPNNTILPNKATITFNLEEGQTLTPPSETSQIQRGIEFYKEEISEKNFISNLLGTASGDGITWDLSTFQFEPNTKYILRKKADDITVWVSGKRQPAYGNEEVVISFTTPSKESAGFSEMEFENPTINKESSYTPNMPCSTLSNIKFGLKDHFYYVDNKEYVLRIHPDFPDETKACQLYEVSENGDRLLDSFSVGLITDESSTRVWYVANINMSAYLYEGKKYKVVIPEGYFTAAPRTNPGELSKANYIKSREMVLNFTGSTPTEAVLKNCSIANNEKVNALYNVVWTFEGNYQLSDENSQAQLVIMRTGLPATVPTNRPVIVSSNGKETYVMIDFVSKSTGKPVYLNSNTSYKLTLPKGMLINVNNNDIVNDEVVLTIVGKDEETGLQKVNVNLTVNGLHASAHKAVKGEAYTFHFNPAAEWVVESVKHGDKELAPNTDDSYTTEPLNADANITATLAYDGPWAVEHETTGIWEIADSNVKIYSEESHIVVAGAQPGNKIAVYTAAGLLVGEARGKEEADLVRISVAPNQVYIVTVDGVAAKIQM